MTIPRKEYPRPQFVRDQWVNLNGTWQFEFDHAKTGKERRLNEAESLKGEILVPFCPECKLSGIGDREFHPCAWYKRSFTVEPSWYANGRRVLLNFEACDYFTEVYINGRSVGCHLGGMTPFTFDITDCINEGENVLTVCAEDENRSPDQPRGKQANIYYSNGASYSRTTGIWQTVWMETVPVAYMTSARYTADIDNSSVHVELTCKNATGKTVKAVALYEGKTVGEAVAKVHNQTAVFDIKLDELHLWDIDKPCLYDLQLTLDEDSVSSYFGMRDIDFSNQQFRLNGRRVFQRLVLDQGYYPEGNMTAPSDEELLNDIKRSKAMGFNGARLHQKVFERRFLYYCDKMGYIVWGEFYDWGLDTSRISAWKGIVPEWLEVLQRDYSHPAIVGWCPLNEITPAADYWLVKHLVDMAHSFDATRPVIEASGMTHKYGLSDYLDIHDYDQSAQSLREKYAPLTEGKEIEMFNFYPVDKPFVGRPVFVSEYGGMRWVTDTETEGWGYDEGLSTEEEWLTRLRELTSAILDNPTFSAFCYTQLTDIEQEINGLYTYSRKPKFDAERVAEIIGGLPSAYEELD